MKPLKLKLATEVIINITFLMVVAVSLIGLVVFKIVEQSILRERYQAGKAQALTLSQLAAPLWPDQTKPELERVAGLFLATVPEDANRGAERVVLADINLEPVAIAGITDRAPIREIERSLIFSALSSRTTLLDLSGGTTPGYLARTFLTPSGPLRVAAPVVSGDQILGGVLLSFPLQGLRASIIRSQRIILFYLLLDILLMLGLGIFLVNRLAVRPIRNLAQVTERVAEGDLSARVKVASANEIGTLAISFNRMVDRIREAQERLLASQQQMVQSEKLASVGRMAAGLAHELGNPLSALLGYADILLKNQELGPEERDLVSRLRNEGLRIDRTIRGMLEFARPAAIELKEINVNGALSQAVELVRGRKLADRKSVV